MASKVTDGVEDQDMLMDVRMVKTKVIWELGKTRGLLYVGSSSRSGFVIFLK